jgi:transcriptional regulator with XRE-family HTH domain
MTIGDKMRRLRINRGYTLEDIANKIKLSKQTLSRYETGFIKNIPSNKIEEIAVALETTLSYLMGWTERKESDSTQTEYIRLFSKLTKEEKRFILQSMKGLLDGR